MVQTTLTVKGDEELQRLLRKISPRQHPEVVTQAMKRGAQTLRREIRGNLVGPRPRRLDVVTGQLLSSIKNVKENYPFKVRVGTRIRWAGKYEFGPVRDRRPFLTPAQSAAEPEILQIFYSAYGRVIRHG